MDLNEFVQTENHPLILAVCRNIFGLEKEAVEGGASGGADEGVLRAPLAEMTMEGVAWPGRDPYPTYFASSRANGRDALHE